jgi:cytochrome d ubiquinol oxidase subunit II
VFSISSALLCVLFGVAVGNVLRGVPPLDSSGNFQGSFAFLLNPFAILAGVLSLVTLCLHGATYLSHKTDGDLRVRAAKAAQGLWVGVLVLVVCFVASSFLVRPDFTKNFLQAPVLAIIPLISLVALFAIPFTLRAGRYLAAFQATSLLIASVLGSAAAGLFPRLMPIQLGNPGDFTLYNSAAPQHSLVTALLANIVGLALVATMTVFIYRLWAKKELSS